MTSGTDLVKTIMNSPDDPNIGILANELLTAFKRGYPVEELRQLLLSRNDEVAKIGAWIASELGKKGERFLGDAVALLRHPVKNVRFFAVDCILCWAGPSNGRELASVIPLMDDSESSVRWKVMDFLSLASFEQLEAVLSYLYAMEANSEHVSGLQWLLGPKGSSPEEVSSAMRSQNALLRKYGIVSAVRLPERTRDLLSSASSDDDPAVNQFVADMIKLSKYRKKKESPEAGRP